MSVLSLFAEDLEVAGLANVAGVQAPVRVATLSCHFLSSVQMVALFAVAASVELPIRMTTARRELYLLSFVNSFR